MLLPLLVEPSASISPSSWARADDFRFLDTNAIAESGGEMEEIGERFKRLKWSVNRFVYHNDIPSTGSAAIRDWFAQDMERVEAGMKAASRRHRLQLPEMM